MDDLLSKVEDIVDQEADKAVAAARRDINAALSHLGIEAAPNEAERAEISAMLDRLRDEFVAERRAAAVSKLARLATSLDRG